MSPSVALLAAKPRERDTTGPAVTELTGKCTRQYVLSVARIVKCLLSLERVGQYIAASATVSQSRAVDD